MTRHRFLIAFAVATGALVFTTAPCCWAQGRGLFKRRAEADRETQTSRDAASAARLIRLASLRQDQLDPPPSLPQLGQPIFPDSDQGGPIFEAPGGSFLQKDGPGQYYMPSQKSPVIQNYGPSPGHCCPKYRIGYRSHRGLFCKVKCGPTAKTVLMVPDPYCCECAVDIPVCIPACCALEQPSISRRTGVLGRHYATYCWSCGYKVEVVFRCRGDVMVHTYGL